jgi:hypothetical protein
MEDKGKKSIYPSLKTVAVYGGPFICFGVLITVLNMTNPLQTGPLSILAVFALLYVFVLSVLCALLHLFSAVLHMIRPQSRPLKQGYYVASVVALAPVLLVALNTLGQLGVLEVVLILLLVGLGCFYMLRRTAK